MIMVAKTKHISHGKGFLKSGFEFSDMHAHIF
jgi:hypothetical protein